MIQICLGIGKVMRFPASQLHVLPPGTPWNLAVLAEPLATACKAVRLVAWLKSLGCGILLPLLSDFYVNRYNMQHPGPRVCILPLSRVQKTTSSSLRHTLGE